MLNVLYFVNFRGDEPVVTGEVKPLYQTTDFCKTVENIKYCERIGELPLSSFFTNTLLFEGAARQRVNCAKYSKDLPLNGIPCLFCAY
jgi:hypothetical protein